MTRTSSSAATAPPADPTLAEIEAALARSVAPREGCPERLGEAMRYALLGPGKRLRPRLVLLATEACGGQPAAAMPAAVAVEMVHAYSLVHDDLPAMDDDDLRRGRPTCHVEFDEPTAILVGDALLARAFEVLATEIQPAELAARCCAELASAAGATALVGGQADDLTADHQQPSTELLELIHRRKTGALFRVCMRLGGIVAGASPEKLAALDTYAENLGLAFQVVDDLLDVYGNEQLVGKRLAKDTRRGKLTYPSLIGREQSQRLVEELTQQAIDALACFGGKADGLAEVARFVARRSS